WSTGTLMSFRNQSNAQCIAQVQVNNSWRYYLSQDPLGKIIEIDEDGQDVVPTHSLDLAGALCLLPYPAGIVNTHTGHIFATAENSASVYEVDPIGDTVTPFIADAGHNPDGLCFSPDGQTIYVAAWGDFVVKGFDMATKTLAFTSPITSPASHPD